ncbi:hypothetical protein KCP69_21005 [Salmonella enterica subsp. enterica]|nr:hypothetical protein KCP69_21005 [Salmonella enterica subsp. enterica]
MYLFYGVLDIPCPVIQSCGGRVVYQLLLSALSGRSRRHTAGVIGEDVALSLIRPTAAPAEVCVQNCRVR